jgi:hypothetical protein
LDSKRTVKAVKEPRRDVGFDSMNAVDKDWRTSPTSSRVGRGSASSTVVSWRWRLKCIREIVLGRLKFMPK